MSLCDATYQSYFLQLQTRNISYISQRLWKLNAANMFAYWLRYEFMSLHWRSIKIVN